MPRDDAPAQALREDRYLMPPQRDRPAMPPPAPLFFRRLPRRAPKMILFA